MFKSSIRMINDNFAFSMDQFGQKKIFFSWAVIFSNFFDVFCLFVWFDSLRPINNLSVKQGRVFLGWTSTKLG